MIAIIDPVEYLPFAARQRCGNNAAVFGVTSRPGIVTISVTILMSGDTLTITRPREQWRGITRERDP
jgi:hypothetical protein